jgi:predicted ArsR family transcriptional regulator
MTTSPRGAAVSSSTTIRPAVPAGRRQAIVDFIKASDSPVTIATIADGLGIHPNTVRFHLDDLVARGQVERVPGESSGRGRPPHVFQARRGMDPDGPRSYRLLAEIALGAIATGPDPTTQALTTGRAWGAFLLGRPPSATAVTEEEAFGRLLELLAELGFAPERSSTGTAIGLRNCPFLELVDSHAQILCPLHLGVMQGAMTVLTTGVTVDRLEPFAEPGLCLAHVSTVDPP